MKSRFVLLEKRYWLVSSGGEVCLRTTFLVTVLVKSQLDAQPIQLGAMWLYAGLSVVTEVDRSRCVLFT